MVNYMKKTLFSILVLCFCIGAFAQSDDQPIAPEFVGKWCYLNLGTTADGITTSCFTLNSDGSFEATLDRGTLPRGSSFPGLQDNDYGKWWVKGSRLFYSSSANGQGSFSFQKVNHPRLENTPMIVLNGVAFAAASSRDPWQFNISLAGLRLATTS